MSDKVTSQTERSIEELYGSDPERADAVIFGRRGILQGASLAAMGAAVGGSIPFSAHMPIGFIPAAMAQTPAAPAAPSAPAPATAASAPAGPRILEFPGKANGLLLLQERPLVAETPEHMLDDQTTPLDKFFVRNNGQVPDPAANPDAWRFRIDGEVNTTLELTVGELKSRYASAVTRGFYQMECGGNGRAQFQPPARGNQWGNGAIGVAQWTGVPLRVLLQAAGVKPSAVYTGQYGADPHLSGDAARVSISRGMPMSKAMVDTTIVAFEMNGQPIPHIHGGPVRMITPGWAGSLSTKWLTRVWIRDRVHDGDGMMGTNYRVPILPMIPGGRHDDANFKIMDSMFLRTIISSHQNGTRLAAGTRELAIRGAAWAGDLTVREVHTSIDFGQTWQRAEVGAPRNRHDWQRWTQTVRFPSNGYFEVWVRGTDQNGVMQPHVAANWNPQGYGANSFHRVAMLIG